ncbi:M1 family metallopeptidase [Arenimonas oryziterrae]|uniref:Peptidase M1 membrane alanine aminopeptidase domain-containing protein n=1 Tax=Arenimonas oryziterrae DSM 21050 = YC6267 TaxID=1121015 RepID=A0A091B1T1_9GAMM|nr:M1 family metallopeptidase [Arenimonas oryziterrae]KFN44864.1 hypothetical protein N789_02275 [Arenimonas oryziterrae DSM 21050 = YC6267]
MARVFGNLKWSLAAALLVAGVASQADMRPSPPASSTGASAESPATDDIPFASPHAAAVTEASAPQAWGGPRTGSEPTLSDRVVDYDIHATLDPVKHTIDGQQKLTWRNRSDREIRSVYLHLYLNAFESSGSTYYSEQRNLDFTFRSDVPVEDGEWGHIELRSVLQNGQKVAWSFVHPDDGPATDHTVVRFDLPTPVAPGGSTTIDIGFHDQLPRVVSRTGYFGSFHLVGQWFPKIGVLELAGERGATAPRWNVHEMHTNSEFYADYGHYDVKLTVPKGYTVGATGEETGAPVEKNGLVTHRFVQGDVHDFAWTADNRTAKPLEGTYHGPGSPPVKVRVLFPPEFASNAAPALKATIDSLKYFSQTLGPYPYNTVTVVIPPKNADEAGGMEYPTFFTAESYDDVTPDTLASHGLDFVTIHEFGHGYFYGLLGSNEFEEPMLDEGLNEYWDMRMLRAKGADIHVTTPFLRRIGIEPVVAPFAFERGGASIWEPADGVGFNSWDRLSSGSYGTVYSRTATMMRDLEAHLGTDVTERAFKVYYARWKFRHPSIADLRDTLAEVSGRPELVDAYFAQQVYATRKVDDRIANFASVEQKPQPGTSEVKGKWVEVTAEQADKLADDQRDAWKKAHPKAKPGEGPFPYRTTVTLRRQGAAVPQTLVVKFADGSSETVHWNENRAWARFVWTKPVKAVSAELDPQGLNLLDANKLDDSRTLEPDPSASRRWSSDVAAVIETAYSLLVTL